MSRPRKDAAPPSPADCSILQRVGLLTPIGDVRGAEASHPDAKLLATIAEFSERRDISYGLAERARRYTDGSWSHNELLRQALSDYDVRKDLEAKIARTPAVTPVGVIAKLVLALEQMDGMDRPGSMWQVPISAIKDALMAGCPSIHRRAAPRRAERSL
jgi:hypothetical protein